MKKVFAFLSAIVLSIAFVGIFSVNNTASAAGKFTVDPTLEEDEDPVYIMDSIYTTFPNFYDNDALADSKWQGAARMYPWNETRLRVAEFGEDGKPTGRYYAIYFTGHVTNVESDGSIVVGAGKNILFLEEHEGKIYGTKFSDGTRASNGAASDPSNSHMRTNITGHAIEVDPTSIGASYTAAKNGEPEKWEQGNGLGDEGANWFNRSIVFDAKGHAIRGVGTDDAYTSAEGEFKIAPEYCYVKSVVTKITEGVTCDKIMEDVVDEQGTPQTNPDGSVQQVETDKDNLIYSRFVWEYFEEEPENVNKVPYLSEGWDPALWDYCYAQEDGGYICIAFVGGADNTKYVTKGDQITAYKKTLEAQGVDSTEAEKQANGAPRTCINTFRIPAGGYVYDLGYNDKGSAAVANIFNTIVYNGYKYGRTEIQKRARGGELLFEGEENDVPVMVGIAEQRTYNFSVGDITFRDQVINNTSYQLLEGQNTVEVMMGDTLNPGKLIEYTGVKRYWSVTDDLTSYKNAADADLDFYITESKNGGSTSTVVEPAQGYTSMDEVKEDFYEDLYQYKLQAAGDDTSGVTKFVDPEAPDGGVAFHTYCGWGGIYPTNSDNAGKTGFMNATIDGVKMSEKWFWIIEKIYEALNKYSPTLSGPISHYQNLINQGWTGSPETVQKCLWHFLTGNSYAAWGDFGDGHNLDWLDTRTSKEKWDAYTIDASEAKPGDNWVVTYRVVNNGATPKLESSLTVKYVVVDSYTPILKVNEDKLFVDPRQVGDFIVVDPIDKFSLVTAHDGQYNGVSILGNDITQNVKFDTELDFANPVEGTHKVTATIYNNAGTKFVSKTFTLRIFDKSAPIVSTKDLTIMQGEKFDCRDGIYYAYDNVDGNLFNSDFVWWELVGDDVDTTLQNEDLSTSNGVITKTVKVNVYDKSNNVTQVQYTLKIVANQNTSSFVTDGFKSVESKVNTLNDLINDVADAVDQQAGDISNLKEQLTQLAAQIAELKTSDSGSGSGCKKNNALLAFSLIGSVSALALVLRRKH